ncbi:MAG TPA: hypothetical protein VGO07_07300 [Candidatus Saccharimonadales bacterium]|jgi:hypothetical protein|nr:hypothetical protein [Candidatus Saccharimonadales bacterium]
MHSIKRLFQVGALTIVSLLVAVIGPACTAGATGIPPTIVRGHFQTASDPACTIPSDDCITDQLTGDFYGRNELTTKDFTRTPTLITYHDQTVITISAGHFAGKQFAGNEHGKINVNTGEFHSCAEFTATDGSGNTLIMRYNGFIDLANNHDNGKYRGAINSHDHCPPSA